MVKFKIKGSKQNSIPLKVKEIGDDGKEHIEKKHLEGETIYDNEKEVLIKKFEESCQKINELTDTLKRLQAEFENYKKRVEKEKVEFTVYAHHDLIEKLLPVLDGFELALKNTSDPQKFIKGIEMICAQLYSVLSSEGLRPIEAVDKKFDPYKHDVLMKAESGKEDGVVLEEFQKGYMLKDKVLRHSKVKVSGK